VVVSVGFTGTEQGVGFLVIGSGFRGIFVVAGKADSVGRRSSIAGLVGLLDRRGRGEKPDPLTSTSSYLEPLLTLGMGGTGFMHSSCFDRRLRVCVEGELNALGGVIVGSKNIGRVGEFHADEFGEVSGRK